MSDLRVGFTGEIANPDSVTSKVKSASAAVKREAGAVVATVQDHPSAAGSAVLAVGAIAFLAGYLLGASGERDARASWRW